MQNKYAQIVLCTVSFETDGQDGSRPSGGGRVGWQMVYHKGPGGEHV
jgi:glycerate-2-kinase